MQIIVHFRYHLETKGESTHNKSERGVNNHKLRKDPKIPQKDSKEEGINAGVERKKARIKCSEF